MEFHEGTGGEGGRVVEFEIVDVGDVELLEVRHAAHEALKKSNRVVSVVYGDVYESDDRREGTVGPG